jgi:hypothetical protein
MRALQVTILAAATALVLALPAAAQKGMGQATGVAREAVKPPVQKMSGTVADVAIGECEQTTGRSTMGAHLMVKAEGDKTINLHLGPLSAVEYIVEQVPVGTPIAVEAFRTEAMPEDAYVAKSITVDDKVIHLRDDNLRPSWAAGRGSGFGMGRGRGRGMGQGSGQGMGQGRGQGMGRGPGGGRGACWW